MDRQDIFYNVQQEESSCGWNSLDGGGSSASGGGPSGTVHLATQREDYLPRDKVVRIMEQVLPPNAVISNDAKETMQKYVSEFVSVVTKEANKRCKCEGRKIMAVEDLLSAMENLGLNNYADILVAYYDRYLQNDAERSIQGGASHIVMPSPSPLQSMPFNGYAFQAPPNTYPGNP